MPADPRPIQVTTLGETMLLGVVDPPGRLRHAHHLSVGVGGAETNVAIALARLGHGARWVGLLGDDEAGRTVLARVRAEGVDAQVGWDPHRPTGLYLREQVGGQVKVSYYRAGSAASALAPDTVDPDLLVGRWLHLSGITGALSPTAEAALPHLATTARSRGLRVSYDVNYRSRLTSPQAARELAETMSSLADLVLVGDDEAEALWGETEVLVSDRLLSGGCAEVVTKRGAAGAAAYTTDHPVVESSGHVVAERDPIGAGDAFAAGYLSGRLDGLSTADCLGRANALGALCVQAAGDYEGLPDRLELEAFVSDRPTPGR